MRWPRSVGGRLSLALLLVVAGALGIVYLVVVPSLKSRLVDARIGEVRAAATAVRRAFDARPKDPDVISNSAARANVRLVRFQSQPPLPSDRRTLKDFGSYFTTWYWSAPERSG